jgi:hypothetical protein
MKVEKYPIADVAVLAGRNNEITNLVANCPFGEWRIDEVGNVFIIMLDDESDPFIIYITDSKLHDFTLFSNNIYLSLNTRILNLISDAVETVCEEFDWDSLY